MMARRPRRRNAMPNNAHEQKLNVRWTIVEDPRAEELLSQAILLILNDPGNSPVPDEIDRHPRLELNERTPVESNNQPNKT
jgi:hypothetical protein